MTLFESSALVLLTANLCVGVLILRALLLRARWRQNSGEVMARLEALSLRVAELSESSATSAPTWASPSPSDATASKAAAFLRRRLRSGAYGLACVGSDGAPRFADRKGHIFVAFFIAEAMAGLLDEIDRTLILARILSEENGGLWGYAPPGLGHDPRPVDADDSAYVLRTLRQLGVNRRPERLLQFYRESERLFVTFDTPGATALATEPSPANNLLAHAEVNANVALALKGTDLEHLVNWDMLRQTQDEAGFWSSYFYPSKLFGTLLMLELLEGRQAFAGARDRAHAFLAGSQNADGSWGDGGDPHETALAVAALAGYRRYAKAVQRGVDHLLSTMMEDGSWSSPATIWFYKWPHDLWRAHDSDRAYVTARCLIALRRAGHAVQ